MNDPPATHPVSRLVFIAIGLLLITALGLVGYGWSLPVYTVDAAIAEQAFIDWCASNSDGVLRISDEGRDAYRAILSPRYSLIDLGVGLASIAVALALLVAFVPSARQTRSPMHRWQYFALGYAGIFWVIGGSVVALYLDYSRKLLPWCADSLIIAVMGMTILLPTLLLVCTIGGLLVARGFRSNTTPLLLGPGDEKGRWWIVTIIAGAFIALGLVHLFFILTSSEAIGAGAIVLFAYVILSARADIVATEPTEA